MVSPAMFLLFGVIPSATPKEQVVDDVRESFSRLVGAESFGDALKIVSEDPDVGDHFGIAVAMDGDTAVVGAHWDDDLVFRGGAAYVFQQNEGGTDNWGQVKKLVPNDIAQEDEFGSAVAINGDTVVVGAPQFTDVSAAYVFERNRGGLNNWGQTRKLQPTDPAAGTRFGLSVDVAGDLAIVGATGLNQAGNDTGAAYVFHRDGGGIDNWGQEQKLTAFDGAAFDRFGQAVALSGDAAAIGAPGDDSPAGNASGSVYLFFNGFTEVEKITPSDPSSLGNFGSALDLDRSTLVVGALGDDHAGSFSGSAYVYSKDEGGLDNWGEIKKLVASDPASSDSFGTSVAVHEDMILIGAHDNDEAASNAGAAYFFDRDQGGANQWGQSQKLVASDATTGANYGVSVAVADTLGLVGADFSGVGGSAYLVRSNPTVDVKANGQDGPVVNLANGQSLQIRLQLDPKSYAGTSGELYVGVITDNGPLFLTPGGGSSTAAPIVQGSLPAIPSFLLADFVPTPGDWIWFFVVDNDTNGTPSGTWIDFVRVTVAP